MSLSSQSVSTTGPRRLLLDSHVFLWLDQGYARLSETLVKEIETCPEVYVSAMSVAEISIKQSIGKLSPGRPASAIIRLKNLIELPVTVRHGEELAALPMHHKDPFDRLLLAQAKVEGLVLVTGDEMLLRYNVPILLV